MDILYLQFEYFFSNLGERGRGIEEERVISREYCECSLKSKMRKLS